MPDSDSVGGSPAGPDPNLKKVIFDKYELGKLLGCGAFAKVYHARDLATNHSVAIKVIPKSRIAKSGLSLHITREIAILRRLRHPNIVRLLEVLASRTKIYFVLEFAKGGELFARVKKFGRLPEHLTRKYFQQLISAVGYCHSRGVFHRDLKPENLLLDEKDDLRVSDFGLSAVSDQTSPDNDDGLFHTLCGTPAYVAPEILAKKGYDGSKVDVWSCGVILFVLNAGYLPFNDSNLMNLYRKIYSGQYRIPKWISPDLKRLISRILDTNPETRISVDEITHDPWFKRGLDREKWTALMRLHDDEKEEEMEERELNAFDLISFSSGVNLSGLFDSGSDRERFVSGEGAEGILGRVEELGRREGCFVERKGQNGKAGVVVRGQNGNLVARVGIFQLTGGYVLVEVENGEERWAQEFWKEKVGPAIKGGGGGVGGGGHQSTPVDGSSGDPPGSSGDPPAPVSC